MTLEEAIEYYVRLAENQKRIFEKYPSQSGKEVIGRFAQLIEWLEELQAYKKERKATGGSLTPEPKSKKIGDDTEIKWSENEKLVS